MVKRAGQADHSFRTYHPHCSSWRFPLRSHISCIRWADHPRRTDANGMSHLRAIQRQIFQVFLLLDQASKHWHLPKHHMCYSTRTRLNTSHLAPVFQNSGSRFPCQCGQELDHPGEMASQRRLHLRSDCQNPRIWDGEAAFCRQKKNTSNCGLWLFFWTAENYIEVLGSKWKQMKVYLIPKGECEWQA